MRCSKCDREIRDNAKVCPYCNHKISEIELDLPALKEDEEDLEKTKAVSPFRDDNELSLIDDIYREMEKKSGEGPDLNVGDNVGLSSATASSILSSKESISKRKVVLIVCGVLTVIAIILSTVIISINRGKTEGKAETASYSESYDSALKTYFDTGEIDNVVYVLERYKNDEKIVQEFQSKTRITCDSWLLTYINEKYENKDEFDKITKKYEDFLYGLNNYAVVKVDGKEIKALLDSDYVELTTQLSTVYDDSIAFFEAMVYYDGKDYNKAYYMFSRIEQNNAYYEKSQYYLTKIIENVLAIMRKDIDKIEKNLDNLVLEDKLIKYAQIEDIILAYDSAYMELGLSKSEDYNRILAEYRQKILDLTNKPADLEN